MTPSLSSMLESEKKAVRRVSTDGQSIDHTVGTMDSLLHKSKQPAATTTTRRGGKRSSSQKKDLGSVLEALNESFASMGSDRGGEDAKTAVHTVDSRDVVGTPSPKRSSRRGGRRPSKLVDLENADHGMRRIRSIDIDAEE